MSTTPWDGCFTIDRSYLCERLQAFRLFLRTKDGAQRTGFVHTIPSAYRFAEVILYNTVMSDPSKNFATTHWSMVLAARDRAAPQFQEALTELCTAYWYPLYAY